MPVVTWSLSGPSLLPLKPQAPQSTVHPPPTSSGCRKGSNNQSLGKSCEAPQEWSLMRGGPRPPPRPGVQSAAGNPNFPAQLSGPAGFRVSLLMLTPSHCLPLPPTPPAMIFTKKPEQRTPLPDTTAFARTQEACTVGPAPSLSPLAVLPSWPQSGSRTRQEALSPRSLCTECPLDPHWIPFILHPTQSRLPRGPFLAAQPKRGVHPNASPDSHVALLVPVF